MTRRGNVSKRVTLLDVARIAGVSRATASLVVRQSPLVGRDTRLRVERAMRELGYVYNVGAARLRQGRSRTVGIIFPNLINSFSSEMLVGIESVLDRQDMAVMVANTWESAPKQDAFLRRMQQHDVERIILCAAAETPDTLPQEVRNRPMPVVQALRWMSRDDMGYAGTDYADGMRQVVRHLVDLGHDRITFAAGDTRHSA